MPAVAYQMPMETGTAIELGKNLFRKQILRVGSISYKGQRLDFTPEYLDGLARAFTERAFDSVPLVFAGADNAHTQDVERIRGEVIGLERNGDRLDAIVQASSDVAARHLRENPGIGVSVRIEQPIERADGQSWPAAVQHVLATANPRITGMEPWCPVDLAAHDESVIDLSLLDFADGGEDATTETQEDNVPEAVFTPEEIARLRALLTADDKPAQDDEADDDGYQMPSDDELAAIAAAALDTDDEREPVAAGAELSAEAAEAIELANSRVDQMSVELAQLRAERDTTRYERERDELAERYGIPPRITELARPLLLGSHVVELSNGGSVDAGEIMRGVLKALGEHVKLIDLSGPTVFETSRDDQAAADEQSRETDAAAYIAQFGLR